VVDATSGTRIAGSIHLPAPVRKGLRELGVDEAASLPVFVEALMSEAGFSVRRHADKDGVVDLEAEINAATVLVRCYPSPGERVPMYAVDRFGCTFEDGDYDEGVFVSDGPLPAGVRRWQRDPRIHLVGRVRLQHFVDAVAARLIRTSIEGAISADPQR
jgi:hypothetical protein